MDTVFSGILVRTGQIAIESSSTLVIGIFVAAVMKRMLGSEGTRRLFGGEGLKGLFRAWLIGSLLPVCSLGVIPVAREMKRAGVPPATILAFVLAAPQLNPLSFLYGLTLSEPLIIISFVIGTMAISIAGGEIWKRYFELESERSIPPDEPLPAKGIKRLLSVVWSAALEAVGPSVPYVGTGIFFTGLLAGLIPHGALSLTMRHDQWHSPLIMLLLGIPAYSGVLPGMMRVGLIFDHGNSVGAAYILFEMGVGMNLGLLAWMAIAFGVRRVFVWFAWIVVMVLLFAYGVEYPLYFAHEEASHTHAFDEWSCPFPAGAPVDFVMIRNRLMEKIEVLEPLAILALLGLSILGLAIPRLVAPNKIEDWLTKKDEVRDPTSFNRWDMDVPGPVLGLAALVGLVVFSVVGLYVYYPNAKEAFAEIVRTRTEAMSAVRSGNKEEAIRQIRHLDLLTRKVQVGVFLREFTWDPQVAKKTEGYREGLEELRDALLAGDQEGANKLVPNIEASYRVFRDAFIGEKND